MVKIRINGKSIEVEEGLTILKAAKKLGIKIPSSTTMEHDLTYLFP